MKRRLFALALLGVLQASAGPAAARPWRVAQVPNGAVASCLTCHVFPGGPRNAFGNTIETYGGTGFLLNGDVRWGTVAIAASPGAPPLTLAQLDSDGDGRTNGEELLDPTDVWRIGQSDPGMAQLVRLPDAADAPVVIRQLYTNGGLPGALFQNDFVELFNRASQPVAIGGWSIQYASATGTDTWGSGPSALTVIPSPLTLQPGQSYLIQEAAGGSFGAPFTQSDLVGNIAFGNSGGKVVLVNDSAALACNGSPVTCTPLALSKIVDFVGYGNATRFEGITAASAPLSHQSLQRARAGCTDINNNGNSAAFPEVPADFTSAPPVQRSSASTLSVCGAVAAVPALPGVWLGILWCLLASVGVAAITRMRGSRNRRHTLSGAARS